VKPHNAYDLAAKLKGLGAPVTLIDYPGLTHEHVAMASSAALAGCCPRLGPVRNTARQGVPSRFSAFPFDTIRVLFSGKG
jgi:acetyl esterase/lipase